MQKLLRELEALNLPLEKRTARYHCALSLLYVDDEGLLESAFMECLDLDDGLVGLPIEQALPVLGERIADVLR